MGAFPAMTPQQFIAKWRRANALRAERLPAAFSRPLRTARPARSPPRPTPRARIYTFERGVRKTAGGHGWADVWMRGHFGWEYKGLHKDLAAAYKQLLDYREDLENPPLLVVCDLDRFEVHTNFTEHAEADLRLRPGGARPAGRTSTSCGSCSPSRTPCGPTSARGDHPRGRRAVRRPGQAAADAARRVGPAGGPLPHEAHVLHVRRADRAAAVEALRPPPGNRQGQSRPCSPGSWKTSFRAMADGAAISARK